VRITEQVSREALARVLECSTKTVSNLKRDGRQSAQITGPSAP
jgi:hypothetical protein